MGGEVLFVTLPPPLRDTLSGLIQHGEAQPNPGQRRPEGVSERGPHLPSCSLRPRGCCTRGSCPCDAGTPSSGSTAPRRKTSRSFLPVGQTSEVCVRHTQDSRLYSPPETGNCTKVRTLFHSLSSLGSSKASPTLTSWSFRELLSADRVSLFPSIPYLVRITAQPNTDALAIDRADMSL